MTKSALLLAIGLILFFAICARQASRLPSGDRLGFWVRDAIYLVSILLVSWPLEIARPGLGRALYLASAFGILFGGFALGLLAARVLSQRLT